MCESLSSGDVPPPIPEADRKRIGSLEIWFRKRRYWSDRAKHRAHRPTGVGRNPLGRKPEASR
ncbi:hypothetical protein CJI59_17685 [Streptomyces sp. Alain-F2R5]|nr:hypothetical protein CJI59_17685 [Streptomyces sp. Alain-F2R5]